MTTYQGNIFFYSETGTEGGHWAFQDHDCVSWTTPVGLHVGQLVRARTDPAHHGTIEAILNIRRNGELLPWPDPLSRDPDYLRSSLWRGSSGDRDIDARLANRYGFHLIYAEDWAQREFGPDNWRFEDDDHTTILAPLRGETRRWATFATPHTEPQQRPYGMRPDDDIAVRVSWCSGQVQEQSSFDLEVQSWSYEGLHILKDGDDVEIYTPDKTTVVWSGRIDLIHYEPFSQSTQGLWINADQAGVDRNQWASWFFRELPARLREVNE